MQSLQKIGSDVGRKSGLGFGEKVAPEVLVILMLWDPRVLLSCLVMIDLGVPEQNRGF